MSFSRFKRASLYSFKSKTASFLLLAFLLLSAHSVAPAATGTLDPTFGTDGKVYTPFEGLNADYGSNVALQADGKIVLAGYVRTGFFDRRITVVRYNTDGSLDTTFGTGGKVITDLPRREDFAAQVAIQSDGKIVVAGYTVDVFAKFSFYDLAVLRYNSNGTPDASFDGDGVRILDFGNFEYINDMLIQPDGKIVTAGRGSQGATITRLNTNGSLDTSFDGDGFAGNMLLDFEGYAVNNVALQPDGKIILSGTDDFTTWFMLRFNSDGTPDVTFDQDGRVTTVIGPTGASDSGLVVQPDGKIIIVGTMQPAINANKSNIALARYNPNGSLDTSFDGDGKVFKHPGDPNLNDEGQDVVLQPDGKIIVLANLNNVPFSGSPHALWGLLRFNTDGSLDPTFNGDGVATASATGVEDIASSMLLQPDGKIVVSGKTGNPSVFALLRFNATAPSPFDYDGDGKSDISVFRPSLGAWFISNSSNSSLTATQFGTAGDLLAPADFDGDAKTDIAVFRPSNGTWYRLNSSNGSFAAVQFGTVGDLPAPADFDGDGRAEIAVFRPSNGTWYRLNSSNNQFVAVQFGVAEAKPVAADYDGDGKSDIAVFRPSTGTWIRLNSSNNEVVSIQFGTNGDKPVAADYDGDNKTDVAVFRPSNGSWYVLNSSSGAFSGTQFGITEDRPSPADFDGDGRADLAVFRPSTGSWYLLRSTQGFTGVQFGISEDLPTPNAFVR